MTKILFFIILTQLASNGWWLWIKYWPGHIESWWNMLGLFTVFFTLALLLFAICAFLENWDD